MEEKGVKRKLLNRINGIYSRILEFIKETEVTIRTKDGFTRSFVTRKGMRQGYVLSSSLLSLYIADLDDVLDQRNKKRNRVRKVQDMVANLRRRYGINDKKQGSIRRYDRNFEKIFRGKKYGIEHGKNKIMIFNSRERKCRKIWKWDSGIIEEVDNFKYNTFMFNRKGNYILIYLYTYMSYKRIK